MIPGNLERFEGYLHIKRISGNIVILAVAELCFQNAQHLNTLCNFS